MKKRSFIVIFLLEALLISVSNGQEIRIMESLSMYSTVLGQEVKYSVCLPEDYFKGDRSYPVVYMLHGLGDDETAWLEYGRINQYADQATKDGEIVPMIFIIPQGFRTYYMNDYAGTFLYQDMFIKEFIPYIDNRFRTIADNRHRATIGYSMGGFGALILPLKHPDLISTCVALSISIRTDQQYMVEDAAEWDQQWGRIFGGVGTIGQDRLTDYFRQNWPFYIFSQEDLSALKEINIYIDNGDDEHTLCRSNEELHILLRDRDFPHEFRVRDGGHTFEYWRSALPNALHFISDAFMARPYRGDQVNRPFTGDFPDKQVQTLTLQGEQVYVYLPEEYAYTGRSYPVIYMAGNFSPAQRESIAALVNHKTENNETGPMLLVFLPEKAVYRMDVFLPQIEEELRIRKGYRFRSLAGYQDMAQEACHIAVNLEQFRSCILLDGFLQKDSILTWLSAKSQESLGRTPFFIVAPDKGQGYEGNGHLHMFLRDMKIKHEYRVMEGTGGFEWIFTGLQEAIRFAEYNFHK